MATPARLAALVACLGMAVLSTGCPEEKEPEPVIEQSDTPVVDVVDEEQPRDASVGFGVGAQCARTIDCRFGLKCIESLCRATGTTPNGGACILTEECAEEQGLQCAPTGLCLEAGTGTEGAACASAADCERGLYCHAQGLAGYCATSGSGDIDAVCADSGGCLSGLACGPAGVCITPSVLFGFEPWEGVACEEQDFIGPARPYFELPDGAVTEFFRLPHPNDARRIGGKLDLFGFPTPGPGLVGVDLVERIAAAAEETQDGFSTTPNVVFRYSRNMEIKSIWGEGNEVVPAATLHYVNIDADSVDYGRRIGFSWQTTDGGDSRYICRRWTSVKVDPHDPLDPATTYAVYLTTGILTSDDEPMVADADWTAMMGNAPPADPVGAPAWDVYQPLRDYLDGEGIPRSDVIGGTVFTTRGSPAVLTALRTAIQAPAIPAPTQITTCTEGAVSPCDDGIFPGTGVQPSGHVRGCFGERDDVWELHMKLALPRAQKGNAPYFEPANGGGLELSLTGEVVLQGTEDVCVSVSIPKTGTMPAQGWPVVLYAGDTDETFRSSVDALGAALSAVTASIPDAADEDAAPTEVATGLAVIGWEGPMSGPRRGPGVEVSTDALMVNLRNPLAAIGNMQQGAADVFELARVVKTLVIPAASSPTAADIRFDPARIALAGHGRGASIGLLAAPYEPAISATMWSSAGASTARMLLARTAPVDTARLFAIEIQELDAGGPEDLDERHPAVGLLAGFLSGVDATDHANVLSNPGVSSKHSLLVYGLRDHYTPALSSDPLARLLKVDLVKPELKKVSSIDDVKGPLSLNVDDVITAAMVQGEPPVDPDTLEDQYDGHFVLFEDGDVSAQVQGYFATWAVSGTPVVPAR